MENKSLLFIASVFIIFILAGGVYVLSRSQKQDIVKKTMVEEEKKDLSLTKYTYENLRKTIFETEKINFGPIEEEKNNYVTRLFRFQVDGKTETGIAHFPAEAGEHPVIIMVRGYVDKEIYTPGMGSNPAARYFASNGFITLAPDLLGFGPSDDSSNDHIEERLLAYPVVLQLIANVSQLNESFQYSNIKEIASQDRLGMWGHSNGGQIALSVLEVTDKSIPTVLWAPVSKPFPYSVLYYSDKFDDKGAYLKSIVTQFEKDYDADQFSLTNYLDLIQSPIQLYQGGKDEEVPMQWSNELYQKLQSLNKSVDYITYPQADHNMVPDWNKAARSSLIFFNTNFK